MRYEEEKQALEAAHEKAATAPFAILRVSDRRWAIIRMEGGTSVMGTFPDFVGYRHATFVEGCEKLSFEDARTKIWELLR